MRRGWATTEFWATVAVAVGSLAASLTDALPPRWAAVASSIAVGAYAVGRGLAKLGPVGTVTLPPAAAPPAVALPLPSPAQADAPPPVATPPLGP